jgi:hypothetical protein
MVGEQTMYLINLEEVEKAAGNRIKRALRLKLFSFPLG